MSEVQSFLGLAGYYRRFIPNFSKIMKPIAELLKKGNKYVWSDACDEAFKNLKKVLTTSPVLAQPDTDKTFDVYCDALLLWFFLCAGEELLPLSGDANEGCQWEVQIDEGWTPYCDPQA
jgi:hypothetical protein